MVVLLFSGKPVHRFNQIQGKAGDFQCLGSLEMNVELPGEKFTLAAVLGHVLLWRNSSGSPAAINFLPMTYESISNSFHFHFIKNIST